AGYHERFLAHGCQGAVLRCRRLCRLPQARRWPCDRAPEIRNRGNAARTLRAALRKGKDDAARSDQQGRERGHAQAFERQDAQGSAGYAEGQAEGQAHHVVAPRPGI
ncbi:hypothetical protein QU38_00515, partial [Staphylococcus aureus]